MAVKKVTTSGGGARKKQHKKRPGIHKKSASSKLKGSKNYIKKSVGQGK